MSKRSLGGGLALAALIVAVLVVVFETERGGGRGASAADALRGTPAAGVLEAAGASTVVPSTVADERTRFAAEGDALEGDLLTIQVLVLDSPDGRPVEG